MFNSNVNRAFNDGYDARLGGIFSMPYKYRIDGQADWLKGWKEADADMKRRNPHHTDNGFKITYWFPK